MFRRTPFLWVLGNNPGLCACEVSSLIFCCDKTLSKTKLGKKELYDILQVTVCLLSREVGVGLKTDLEAAADSETIVVHCLPFSVLGLLGLHFFKI